MAERAKPGIKGVSVLHEQVADVPEKGEEIFQVEELIESPVEWGKPYDDLTSEEQSRSRFTDGSAHWKAGKRRWKAGALNPTRGQVLEEMAEGKSSQWAELEAVHMAIHQAAGVSPVLIY